MYCANRWTSQSCGSSWPSPFQFDWLYASRSMPASGSGSRVDLVHVLQKFLKRWHFALLAQHGMPLAKSLVLIVEYELEDLVRARIARQFRCPGATLFGPATHVCLLFSAAR